MTNLEKINNLVVGQKYSISVKGTSIYNTRPVMYVGYFNKEYWFTCGDLDSWKKSFNFTSPKSRLIIH